MTRAARPAAQLGAAFTLVAFLLDAVERALDRAAGTAQVGATAERPPAFDWSDPLGFVDLRIGVSIVVLLVVHGFFEIAWIRLFHAELTGSPITAREAVRGATERVGQLVFVHLAFGVIAAGSAAAIILLAFERPLTALLTVPAAVGLATVAAPYVAAALAAVALTPSGRFVLPAARQAVTGQWDFGLRAVMIAGLSGSAVATALVPLEQFEFPVLDTLLRSAATAACAAVQAASLAALYHALGGWAADAAPE